MGEPITEERLIAYSGLAVEVESYQARIARMKSEEKFPAMRPGDGSQHTPGKGDRLERAVIRRLEYEEKMAPSINAAKAEMQAIEDAVNALKIPRERVVLRLRYLESENDQPVPWKDVAYMLTGDDDIKDVRKVQRLCDKALVHIAKQEKSHQ